MVAGSFILLLLIGLPIAVVSLDDWLILPVYLWAELKADLLTLTY